jgi:hypothetical protein
MRSLKKPLPLGRGVVTNTWLVIVALSILCLVSSCGGGGNTPTAPVDPPPVLGTMAPQSVTVGSPVTFSVDVISGTPPFTFLWQVASANQSDNSASLTLTPTMTGSEKIQVTVTNGAGAATVSALLTVDAAGVPPPPPVIPSSGFVQEAACGYGTADLTCTKTTLNVTPKDFLAWIFISSPTEANLLSIPSTTDCNLVSIQTVCFTVTDTEQDVFYPIAAVSSGPINFVAAFTDEAVGGNTALELPSGLNPSDGTLLLLEYVGGTVYDSWPCPPSQPPFWNPLATSGSPGFCTPVNLKYNNPTPGSQTSFNYNMPNACSGSGSNLGVEITVIVEDSSIPLLAGAGSSQRLNVSATSENVLVQDTLATTPSTTIAWNSASSLAGSNILLMNIGLNSPSSGCN